MALEKLGDDLIEEIRRLSQEGYTQKAIAEKLEVSTGVVSKYTRGKRRLRFGYNQRVLEKLCEILTPMVLKKLKNKLGRKGYA